MDRSFPSRHQFVKTSYNDKLTFLTIIQAAVRSDLAWGRLTIPVWRVRRPVPNSGIGGSRTLQVLFRGGSISREVPMADVLDQSEVDALLAAVESGGIETAAERMSMARTAAQL